MLKLISISSPRDQHRFFENFDPEKSTWLVSDLKSKLDLNRKLLQKRSFIPGESVLRASELWRIFLTRLRPDLQPISKEFAITLISNHLSASGLDWAQAPGAAQVAYEYMTQLMPILSHPNGEEMMQEWFTANPDVQSRWGRWFELTKGLWTHFLSEGFIAPTWATGVLANELNLVEVWEKPLIVDLGAELDQVEADILVQLAARMDITVLKPDPEWANEYGKALQSYDIFERKIKVTKEKLAATEVKKPLAHFRKYTTMIAEVKDAVAQIRTWLATEKELQPSQIAVVATDIESYWGPLAAYLDQEGIPSQKDRVRKLHTYPDIARWLAVLRLKTGSFSEVDVELGLFHPDGEKRAMTYELFKTLYAMLYSREDLNRSEIVAKKFAIELKADDEAWRDDFVAWSLKQLPHEVELQRIEAIFKKLLAECPQSVRLPVKRWLAYFEQLAAKTECRIKDGHPDGVACISLASAENSPATHMIFLGLTESLLKPGGGTAILFSDIASLSREYGFHLPSDDQARVEFEARWILEDPERTMILSVPETDFAGAAQAPSWLWVRGARGKGEHENLSVPAQTRWDEIQLSGITNVAKERSWSDSQKLELERTLSEDLGQAEPRPFGLGLVTALSPSGIEDYLECPFIFAAKRIFALSDVAELDLEVDASRRGSLMHKVFEMLTEEPFRAHYSESELSELIEKAKEQSGLELADERLWNSLKGRYSDLARRFLSAETEYRAQFATVKTIGRETDIAGYLVPETGDLSRDPVPGALRFAGRIDRIDQDGEGNLAIYDYKSSAANVSQWSSWLKKNRIQLLLYAIAVEKGLTSLTPGPVLAALYYTAKPLSRSTGFLVEFPAGEFKQGLYQIVDRRVRNRVSEKEKENLFAEGKNLVKKAVAGILAGDFKPNPRDRNKCQDCQWSLLCRAPHLNT